MYRPLIAWCAVAAAVLSTATTNLAESPKPRIVVLTDIAPNNIEPDDMESIIRLFAHADQFEIEALIATTGWSNGGGQERLDLIHDAINAYEEDLGNLRKISNQEAFLPDESKQAVGYWPSPDYLRSRTVLGSKTRGQKFIGKDNQSAGSDLIIQLADESDDRPLWILAWGGGNTLAQSIWQVKESRSTEELNSFLSKVPLYTITDQDRGFEKGTPFDISSHQWLRREFKNELMFLWDESAWTYQNGTGKERWDEYAQHIQGHGNLGALYPKYKYGVEGDTPSFLYVWPNGLNDPKSPGAIGWGGYFEKSIGPDKETEAYTNYPGTPANRISRKYQEHFYPAIFNSFAARMDWAKDGVGNRNPQVTINDDRSLSFVKLTPAVGETITLDASATVDPDGDTMQFSWWVISEASTYRGEVPIIGNESNRATVTIPTDAIDQEIHVVCEVTDQGVHPLTSYRRIVIQPQMKKE